MSPRLNSYRPGRDSLGRIKRRWLFVAIQKIGDTLERLDRALRRHCRVVSRPATGTAPVGKMSHAVVTDNRVWYTLERAINRAWSGAKEIVLKRQPRPWSSRAAIRRPAATSQIEISDRSELAAARIFPSALKTSCRKN